MREIRQALRSIRRTPAFSLTALLALALGIGAATTVFSVADAALFRPLPYHDADALVTVGADIRSRGQSNWAVSGEEFDAWRESSRSLADLSGHQTFGRFAIAMPDGPVEAAASRVTENFLDVLGVLPALGRPLVAADFTPGAVQAVLVTDGVWRSLFQADPTVVGRAVTVNDAPATIVGVLPRSFVFPDDEASSAPGILVPLVRTPESSGSRISMIGRLAPGATIDEARAEIDAMARARAGDSGLREGRIDGATVEPLAEALTRDSRALMWLLIGGVAALALIGCANVANLMLARGMDRRGELAVHRALGASDAAIVRLLTDESAVLAAAGGAAGALLSWWAVSIVGPLVPADLTLLGPVEVSGRALAFTAVASALSVVVAGLGPAIVAARANVTPALGRSAGWSVTGRLRARRAIVALEVALAVVLLVGGGLMVNTLARLRSVDHGFPTDDVLTMRVELPRGRTYPQRSRAFLERTLAGAAGVPGVTSAGAIDGVPFANTLYGGHYIVDGFPPEWMREGVESEGGACCTQTHWVSGGYFDTLGLQVLRGRTFTAADASGAVPVAIISERLARKFPAGVDPLGHYLAVVGDDSDRRQIVGIVRDVRFMALERRPMPTIYLPIEERGASALTLLIRSSVDPLSIAPAVGGAVQREAGPVVVTNVQTLDQAMLQSVGSRRLNAWLFGSFGAVALVLAAVGIAGVISYSVARRTREIGLRVALGATPPDVRRLVMVESLIPVLAGLAAGIGAALVLSRFVASLLYEVAPRDVMTYAAAALTLVLTTLVAAYVPARRASRVSPIEALRVE